jgi:hypothetical protein
MAYPDLTGDTASILERIDAELMRTLRVGLGLETKDAQHWQAAGNEPVADASGNLPPWWLVLTAGDLDLADEAAIQTETVTITYTVDIHVGTIPAGLTDQQTARRLIARAHEAVMTNRMLEEGGAGSGGDRLAIDLAVIAPGFGPLAGADARDMLCGIELEITARTPQDDVHSTV